MKKLNKKGNGYVGSTIFLAFIAFNLTIGGLCVDYILSWFSKDIPFIADMAIGLFTAEFALPVAVIGAILKACGIF